jgi:hypothetical protein
MHASDVIAALALVVSIASGVVSILAYRRTLVTAAPVLRLRLERFGQETDWWFVRVHVQNRLPFALTPTEIRVRGPRRAAISNYTGPMMGSDGHWTLPGEARQSGLTTAMAEDQIAKLTPAFAEGSEHELPLIVYAPENSWFRTLKLQLSVRTHDSQPKIRRYSLNDHLPKISFDQVWKERLRQRAGKNPSEKARSLSSR